MNLFQTIKMSLQEIKSNKLRSFLTILGTAIGTASVILFVTISIGSRQAMYKEMEVVSSDIVTANFGIVNENKTIKYEDIDGLLNFSSIEDVSPVIKGSAQVESGRINKSSEILGVDENYKSINKLKTKYGRFLNTIDLESYNKVVVIGSKVANELFQLENPVGKYIQINSTPYKIVGVLEQVYDGYELPDDSNIYVPLLNAKKMVDAKGISTLYIKAKSIDTIYSTTEDSKSYLINKVGSKEDVSIESNQQMAEMMESMDAVMDVMVGAVSSISLFVAGIGIMNMMLVSVTERTKEIGIRKSLGAKRKSILTQFLIESLTISLIGGVVGAVVGILGSNAVLTMMGGEHYIAWNVVALAVIFAVAMGVIFGISPANKASKLQPIKALKSE